MDHWAAMVQNARDEVEEIMESCDTRGEMEEWADQVEGPCFTGECERILADAPFAENEESFEVAMDCGYRESWGALVTFMATEHYRRKVDLFLYEALDNKEATND